MESNKTSKEQTNDAIEPPPKATIKLANKQVYIVPHPGCLKVIRKLL